MLICCLIFPLSARNSDIVQIAAASGEKTFSRYVLPIKRIHPDASAATGLTVRDDTLYHKGTAVPTVSLSDALLDFVDFISSFEKPILAGHNVQNFDVPVLYNSLKSLKMTGEFQKSIDGFFDTLKIVKSKIKKSDLPENCKNYKQESLVHAYCGESYGAHNAIADVVALQKLYRKLSFSTVDVASFVFPLNVYPCSLTLDPLVDDKVISRGMKRKLSESLLGLQQLKLAYKRDPVQGIASVFKEPTCPKNKPRISNSKKVIDRVNQYVANH